jgi:hypothetical protein
MTDTETETNPIANEAKLFDTFASLNAVTVKISLRCTDQYFNSAYDDTVIKTKDGKEIKLNDIDGEPGDIYEALGALVEERVKCLAIYPLKDRYHEEGRFFKGIEAGTITLDIAKRTITVDGTINYETNGDDSEDVDPMVFKPDEDHEVA